MRGAAEPFTGPAWGNDGCVKRLRGATCTSSVSRVCTSERKGYLLAPLTVRWVCRQDSIMVPLMRNKADNFDSEYRSTLNVCRVGEIPIFVFRA